MKKYVFPFLLVAMSLLSLSAFSQKKDKAKNEAPKEDTIPPLGLAGDNLDLYAVLDLFQKSKTVEAFEKSLNDEKEKINNLDLNLDKKVDFIKVVTKKDGDSYQFVLRVDISKTESQDVAVILLDKDKDKKISLQIVGDEELYGKDYVIEPKGNSSVTPNPGYKGDDPVTVTVPAPTTTVVVQQAPIVQYVYSPAYVPYVPPYYYGFYPPWFGFATVMAVGIYRSNHWGYHGGYYGGHYGGNNNVIINTGNRNNFNNYNNNKMRSTTVSDNRARGSYGDGAGANRRNNASVSNRQSSSASNRQASNRPSTSNNMSNRQSPSASNRQTPSMSNNMSTRQTPSASTRQSSGFSSPSTRSSSYGGGGRSMSGGGGGGRSMGGGGGGRRR